MAIDEECETHFTTSKQPHYVTTAIDGNVEPSLQVSCETLKSKKRYTRRQWVILIVCCCANLCAGFSYSLQAPFYPLEAAKKGVPPRVYGFVFGCFDFVNFLACPVFGRHIRTLGPKFMQNAGAFTMGGSCILFGLLDAFEDPKTFIAFSFAIRIVEALGLASYLTATYAIVSQEFSENVASIFSIVETIFGLGMIGGPAIGSFLYALNGYTFPFALIGSCLITASIVSYFILPEIENTRKSTVKLTQLLKIPSIAINYFANVSFAFSLGFINALLEPHIAKFNLEPTLFGFMFTLDGAAYALTATFWGILADKYVPPKVLCSIGALLLAVSFLLLGPAPFLPVDRTLWMTIVALIIHGVGTGGVYVVAFLDSIQEATRNNFPNNIETYGLISGLWTSGLALGNFIGPSVSGVLNDSIGFPMTATVVFALQMTVVILTSGYYIIQKCKKLHREDETETSETISLLHSQS